MTAERKMWLGVIIRAQREAEGSFVYGGDPRTIKYCAIKWLTHDSTSRRRVCELAGLNEIQRELLLTECVKKYGKR